jgi:hypothetical protein
MDLDRVLLDRLHRDRVSIALREAPQVDLISPDQQQVRILRRVKMAEAFTDLFVINRTRMSFDGLPVLGICPFLVAIQVS